MCFQKIIENFPFIMNVCYSLYLSLSTFMPEYNNLSNKELQYKIQKAKLIRNLITITVIYTKQKKL